jgi:hypothetical protein
MTAIDPGHFVRAEREHAMDFILTELKVMSADRLQADFDVRHPSNSMQGTVSVVLAYAMSDTLAQIVVRAREMLERSLEEG